MCAAVVSALGDLGGGSFVPLNAYVQRWEVDSEAGELLGRPQARKLPKRFHFLVSSTNGTVIEPVLSYLKNIFTLRLRGPEFKRKRSALSQVAAAYDLKDLADFLDAQKYTFADLSTELLNAYIASMSEVRSPVTNRPYADLTIRRRVSTAKQFCKWAQSEGLLKHRFDYQSVEVARRDDPDQARRSITKFAVGVDEPPEPDKTAHVNVLHLQNAPVLLNALGPLPQLDCLGRSRKLQADTQPLRNRLMSECSLQTGLRRAEVVGFTLESLKKARTKHASSPTHLCVVKIRGKYGRWRNVNFPFWLIEALRLYVNSERESAVEAGRRRAPAYEEPTTIFVNHAHSIRAPGAAVTVDTFNEVFRQAQIEAGMASDEEIFDEISREKKTVITVPHVVHDLRHSFAVWTYWARKQAGDQEPWKYIQAQLGHKSLSTTTDIYLSAATLFEAQFSDRFTEVLKERIYA